jgi:hypothetical protein
MADIGRELAFAIYEYVTQKIAIKGLEAGTPET